MLGLTYTEVVGAKANIFLSFAYMDNFADLVDAMELFLDTNASQYPKESTYFWFDMLVNSQWGALDKDFIWWATTFKEAVVEIGKTVCFLSPWSNPTIFSRAWCLLEICYSKNLSIILSKTEESRFHSTLISGDITGITTAVSKIDLEKANCYIAAEKKQIFDVVESMMPEGFSGFNNKVKTLLRAWVFETARLLTVTTIVENDESRLKFGIPAEYDLVQSAKLHKENGRFEEAKALLERALAGRERILGVDHRDTLFTLVQLASIHKDQGRLNDAKALLERALAGQERILGVDHRDTLHSLGDLAAIACDQGHLDVARVQLERALAGQMKRFKNDAKFTSFKFEELARRYEAKGLLSDAQSLFELVYSSRETLLGPHDKATQFAARQLAKFMRSVHGHPFVASSSGSVSSSRDDIHGRGGASSAFSSSSSSSLSSTAVEAAAARSNTTNATGHETQRERESVRVEHPRRVCFNFMNNGGCTRGASCKFIHQQPR